jgi:RNA polymerase sigma-70 factor (ECF subfamily)
MAQVWVWTPVRVAQWARRWPRALVWRFTLADAGASPGGAGTRDASPAAASTTPAAGYEAFVREHERAILNYLWRMTGDEQGAYDLTQEVFLRAWQRFDQVRGYDNPRAWLFRVATNLALTTLARRRPLTSEATLDAENEPAVSDPSWRLVRRDLVRRTLQRLNPQRRAALCLREVYGLSYPEVAKALGVSVAAARMTLSRACEQFRELYLREEGDEHDA